ncbi:zinc finger protein 37-like [Penaeus monodon]|uniref:zinc finger protein 37-like n=1 Tax=Penaeus monodon TaxID=6687 RepID=UPI0018A73428|nr:zinc finger protein 37-like [Penaeus monodon]
MGELQLFQHLVYEIKSLFIHAKTLGWIEKYEFEIGLQPRHRQAPSNEHSVILQKILLNLQNTIQMMLAEQQRPLTSSFTSEVPSESKELTSYHPSPPNEIMCYASERVYRSDKKAESELITASRQEPEDKLTKCLPQQLPTTKEAEAANVLMNLSGKAADRVGHTRLESCTILHQEVISSDATKPTLYMVPSGTSNSNVKREYPVCDEVPQINEKDLLPLATQVLCQFCSQQCEDLVELHEHVLAMHNMCETEPPFMTSYKKLKNQSQDEDVESRPPGEGRRHRENKDKNYEQESHSLDELLIPVTSSGGILRHESEKRKFIEDKKAKKKPRSRKGNQNAECKSASLELCNKTSHSEGQDSYSKNVWDKSNDSRQDIIHDINVSVIDNIPKQYSPLTTDQVHLEEKEKSVPIHHPTEVPVSQVTGDALAIAIESSKIRVIEAKVTIFVCLKCSSCYTNAQEFRIHACSRIQPVIERCPDGSVVLVKHVNTEENQAQLSEEEVWYFPEFLIRQQRGDKKQTGDLEIVDTLSGHRLQLYTAYQPSYLSEQLISFRCPTCEKDSDSLGKFFDHLTKGPCMFRCPDCSLVYVTQDKLQKHRSSLHPTLEDRTCPNCHEVFEKRHQRNKHVKTQCSQLHICDTCGSVLKNEYNLRVHMLSHQDRKHICSECGAAFHRRVVLTRHMMHHSGTKPHACPQCNARFYTKQHLKTHLDRHSGIKRFPCSACDKAYYSKHERNTHFAKMHNRTQCGEKALGANDQKIVKLTDISSISFI